MRESLQVAQKDGYNKGVKHMMFQTGDLVLRYTPQQKPGEANKFHRQWEGPFKAVERVTDVTYRVKNVWGQSIVIAPQGGSEESERVAPAC